MSLLQRVQQRKAFESQRGMQVGGTSHRAAPFVEILKFGILIVPRRSCFQRFAESAIAKVSAV